MSQTGIDNSNHTSTVRRTSAGIGRGIASGVAILGLTLGAAACSDDDGDSTDIDNPVDGVDDQIDSGAEELEEEIDSETEE